MSYDKMMLTGDVSRRMGVQITEAQIRGMGFTPVQQEGRAVYWAVTDYPVICRKFGEWVAARADAPPVDRPAPKPKKEKVEKAGDKAPPAPPPAAAPKPAFADQLRGFDDDDDDGGL